ncbi:MAG: thioredoxin family protein [Chitinophagaceae bacterium]|nr:MAG: thioredoxin family protein [Chitinophagaceae bacterium]
MKTLLLSLAALFLVSVANAQQSRLETALSEAHAGHKQVLLRFSGSDWCIPCIRMEKELFSDTLFHSYAGENLVMVAADFPRLKKNRLPKEVQAENDRIAEKYNAEGSFPMLLLLDENGKVLRRWEGYVGEKPAAFVGQLASLKAP